MIENYSFGQLTINGEKYNKDVKICANEIVHPWWRKEGHIVEKEDIKDILQVNPEILVLGKGNPGMMKASKDLKEFLQNKGILLLEEPSAQAVDSFNQYLEQGKKVCAGFHLTC